MILIAHRGNIDGAIPEKENHPDYIDKALKKDYNVEIDVWYENSKWYLGHDEPQYEVKDAFFYNNFLWCHAKNIEALQMLSFRGLHCFWHQTDDVTMTTRGYLWTYPGKKLTTKSICVMPERASYTSKEIEICAGVCSDEIEKYRLVTAK
tara:strand:+ start:164 stop:613 length:450 start_codon:yes stop_codon:yes gene_type:complete